MLHFQQVSLRVLVKKTVIGGTSSTHRKMMSLYKIYFEILKGENDSEDLGVDGEIILRK